MADGARARSGLKDHADRPRRREAVDDRSATERILDSAEGVLRREGYAGFTFRRVAEAAGMALGNLSYHYPTKVELLRALIKRLIAHYSGRLQAALRPPEPGLEVLLRWLLEEAVVEENNSLFRELWAMALHDEVVREAVDDFYDQLMEGVEAALLAAHPTADPDHVRELVQLLAVISEGSAVLYGTRRARRVPYARTIDHAVRLIGLIAPDLASPSGARDPGSHPD